MPLFKHKGYKGGRADDPHGVTAATRARSEMLGRTMSSKDPVTGRVSIDSTPMYNTSNVYSDKEKKSRAKGLKEINDPKNRNESQYRGTVYNRAKADETARMKNPIQSDIDGSARGGVAEAYAKGGVAGVKSYDKKTFGKDAGTTGEYYKQEFEDPKIREKELNPYR
jgi:hypothetical protein